MFNSEREEGLGGSDLYISFKKSDGGFAAPQHLGPQINTPGHEFGASLSPDGRYLFFARSRDLYWVDIKRVIKERFKR